MEPFNTNCKHLVPERIDTQFGIIYHCWTCGKDITHWWRRFWNGWVRFKIYCSRGEVFIADINAIYNLLISAATGVTGYKIAESGFSYQILILPVVIILQKALVFWLGYMDYNHWHLAQRENTIGASLSPITTQSYEMLREIHTDKFPESERPNLLEQIKR